jgi:hypothetical protein
VSNDKQEYRNMTHHLTIRGLLGPACLITCSVVLAERANAADRPDITEELRTGRLAAAEKSLANHLSDQPTDDLARFQLGAVQFFAAVEGLAQDSYRYGLKPNVGMVPFLRSPIEANPHPEPVDYTDVRTMIARFVDAVEQAEATLAPVQDTDLEWELDLTAVRLDMNGDGQAKPDETLWSVFARFATPAQQAALPESFKIGLDSADVHWLRGYCHLLSALGDMILAYDHQRQFDHTAQLFFANPQTPYSAVLRRHADRQEPPRPWDQDEILDAVAFIHLASFPVREPERLTEARDHLLAMIKSSRKSWQLIEAESDNNREWIPGPDQTSVVEGVAISKERLAAWRRFLKEGESVLNGDKLIPFWRGDTGQGVNLLKVFTQPEDFDLVLWVQGSAAVPYLEEGEVTSTETWAEFQRVFEGRFLGFAIWIN